MVRDFLSVALGIAIGWNHESAIRVFLNTIAHPAEYHHLHPGSSVGVERRSETSKKHKPSTGVILSAAMAALPPLQG